MMKKILTIIAAVLVIFTAGCSKEFDDSALNNRIDSLEKRMSALETVMNAYNNNLFIKSVQKTDNGYVITFSDGSTATIVNGKDGADGKDGVDGKDGADGKDGVDGDTLIDYIVIGENKVTFVLTDGRTFSITLYSALSIMFDEADLVVMSPNSTREIHYSISSIIPDVEVEVVSSADIKAKVVAASATTGAIEIKTGAMIDEYSKIVIFVSNGEKVIMRRFTFEQTGLQIKDNATKETSAEGGELVLEFMSNVECEVLIPESALSWISIVPETRTMEPRSVILQLEPNKGHNRNATVTVQSTDSSIKLAYLIEQEGDLGVDIDPKAVPDNEIWYVMADKSVYDVYQTTQQYGHQPFDAIVVSNTYQNGKGVIKFDRPVKRINNHTFGNGWAENMTELYLPDCIEYLGIGAISETGLTTFRTPANLKYIGEYALNNTNIESFTGAHVSEDGKCVIIGDILYAFAPKGLTEYTIPNGVKEISDYVFSNYKDLENVQMPEGLIRIGACAFERTKIKKVNLPSTLEHIGHHAFLQCLNIEGFYGNEKFHTSDNRCLISDANEVMGGWAIVNFAGENITEYTIPEGIDGIENYAFYSATILKSITLSNSLKWVGSVAFDNCAELEYVYGPHTSNDNRCIVFDKTLNNFVGRKGLAEYYIPEHIEHIGDGAFENSELEKVYMGDQIKTIGGYAFAECHQLKTLILSASLKNCGYPNFILASENLEAIYMRTPMPPAYSDTQMTEYSKLKLYVPKETYELYMNSQSWKDFRKYFVPYHYEDLDISQYLPDYYSTDYSQDGKVEILQKATKGNGIDVVLMGDAYSDRQIADGTYMKAMQTMVNNLFNEEPYKSFRELFNIYVVNVVSAIEGYEYGNTALSGFFGNGTLVGGNDNVCFSYALNAISEERMDEALIVVAMNKDAYAGTCYMYYPGTVTGAFGNGPSVAYFPTSSDTTTLSGVVLHEAGGHGFSKLADEYDYGTTVSAEKINATKVQQNDWGWWKNVDFTSNPLEVRWNHFLNDHRYANDGLGVYEGGLTHSFGVWRPTENSIMRYNTGGFNAPSREAIYYRIHKLAYGDSWQYNYEDFVKYDEINRKAAASAQAYVPSTYKPTHPPVVVNKSWRDAK